MNKREQRVVDAFINCVKNGEFSLDYAITLIEDTNKYGYLTEESKEIFYKTFGLVTLIETNNETKL